MDYLQEARENYKEAQDAVKEQYERIREDFRFSNPAQPEQWDSWATEARKGRPTHTLDRTNQFVQHVVNKHRESKISAQILPVDSKSDPEVAKRIAGIIRHIEYVSKADIAWDTASDHQARGGLGWIRVLPKVVNPENNEQEIIIQRVHDPLSCCLDPNSTEPDGSDAMFGFVETTLTKTAFRRLYPKAKMSDWDSEGWFGNESVRIAEYFRVTETKSSRLNVILNGQRATLTEDDYWKIAQTTGVKPEFLDQFDVTTKSVKWCKLSGAEILEETEFPSQWIGLVPVLGHEIWIEGKRYLCGLVRRLMDGQKLHNYEMSALTESLMIQPKAPFLVPGRAIEGYEGDWAKLNSGNPAYLPYNDVSETGTEKISPPTRLSPPQFPNAYAQTANMAVQEMEAATGMPKPLFGMHGAAASGVAKRSDVQQGETATFHFLDNRRIAQEQVYRIILDMMPRIYDSRRQAQILGEDGQQSSITINPDMPVPVMREGNKVVAINIGVGRYDVRVKTGPSYTTIREEMGVKLQELGKGNPVLAAALTPILMKLSDMPEADKVAKIAMAMLPPEVQKAYTDEEDMPTAAKMQIQQQGQQIQQMAQAMDQASNIIKTLEGKLQEKNNEVQLEAKTAIKDIQLAQEKLNVKAIKLDADRQVFAKDREMAQMQMSLFDKQSDQKPEKDDAMTEEALKMLNESIVNGHQMIAAAIEKQSQSIQQLQQLTVAVVEGMDEVAETITSPRKIVLERDKNGRAVGATSMLQ